MPLGGCHFSGSNNTTTSKSSSFFNSRSTNDTFDAEQLHDPSLDINPMCIFNDQRFNAIVGLEALDTFTGLVSQQISVERSRHLYQAFHSQYCDIFKRCEFIGGFDSVLGVDHQNLGKTHWKHMSSWPAVLEYIVSILNTLRTRLMQSQACDGFTREGLLEAAEKPLRRLFTVASVVCVHQVRKSPEMLFIVLNMYTSLTDAIPALWDVFYTDSISRDAEGLLAKLKDSATEIVKELRSLVQNYSSRRAVQEQDGGIMSLTAYLMRYIRLLTKHKSSLDTMLGHGHTDHLLTVEVIINPTGRLLLELIADLDSVLEKQTESFSSRELQCLFLMNNTHFILQEVKRSDVRLMVGSRWIEKRQDRFKKHMKGYLSASWGPVISNLETAKGMAPSKRLRTNVFSFLHSSPTPVQNFSWSFDETCQTQMSRKVPSPVLREELRGEILALLTGAYHAYLERVKNPVKGNAADFKPEWKSKINELFEG